MLTPPPAAGDRPRTLRGDGFLSVDGRVIYGMKGFAIRAV
jgi:hypothetical protein